MTTPSVSRPLPVAWDGDPIRWKRMNDEPTFICPPPKDTEPDCPACDSLATRQQWHGMTEPPRLSLHRRRSLLAYRCLDCGLDQVWDAWDDTTWDLDDSDYGPGGSWAS